MGSSTTKQLVPWMTEPVELRVETENDRFRVLSSQGSVSADEAREVLAARTRERFDEALRSEGIVVPPSRLLVELVPMTDAQKRKVLARTQASGVDVIPRGTALQDFDSWVPVAYALVGTTLYVHGRNLFALSQAQGDAFMRDHVAPLIRAELGEGATVSIVEIELP